MCSMAHARLAVSNALPSVECADGDIAREATKSIAVEFSRWLTEKCYFKILAVSNSTTVTHFALSKRLCKGK